MRTTASRILLLLLLLLAGSAAAQHHPDDVYWDDRFTLPGVSGGVTDGHNPPYTMVNALASHGDVVFAGGDFTWPDKFVASWNHALGKWEQMGGGVDGVVHALCVVGDDVYVGGNFSQAGDVPARGIARWNITTRTWSAVGGGVQGLVQCLEYDGTYLYAAGHFAVAGSVGANNIARWNGAQWEPLGSGGTNGIRWAEINDMAVYQGRLYAGLTYGFAGTDTNNRDLVVWDGSSWSNAAKFSPLYDNGAGLAVNALAVYNGTLIVGGSFDTVGVVPANGLVQWDGSQWRSLDSIGGIVRVLCVDGDNLYVGGKFDRVAQVLASNIAIRNMATGKWSAAGSGAVSPLYTRGVCSMTRLGSDIYAGGNFPVAGSLTVNYIARWRSQQKEWSALARQSPAGVAGGRTGIFGLALYQGQLAAVGDFLLAGDIITNGIGMWNEQRWRAASGGVNNVQSNWLYAVATHGNDLYVCGSFDEGIGGNTAKYLAAYDGSAWRNIGTPGGSRATNKFPHPWPEMHALYHDGSRLYAGGEFTTMGSAPANCIAEWDGQQWRPLGSGVANPDEYVYAITKNSAGTLYAGGDFTVMGGIATGGLAQWNGASWDDVGGQVNGTVFALATDGSDLYAAGQFSQAGGRFVNNIARWDGTQWHDLNGGTEAQGAVVYALAVHNKKLYAAGRFVTMGGVLASNIAVWDMQSGRWEPLGSGIDSVVRALAVYNGDLYAGGSFTVAGGKFSGGIARWSKQAVSSVGENDLSSGFVNAPNPATETTVFSFVLDRTASVSIIISDLLGREVLRPLDGTVAAGSHHIHCAVGTLPAGVYTAVLKYGEQYKVLRMVVVK